MHGTVPQKIGRVITSLALHPQYISRCIHHNLLNGKTPLDLELPWFSYAAIDFLEDFLQPHMTVCEYGSGGSTLFFSRRGKSGFFLLRQFQVVRTGFHPSPATGCSQRQAHPPPV